MPLYTTPPCGTYMLKETRGFGNICSLYKLQYSAPLSFLVDQGLQEASKLVYYLSQIYSVYDSLLFARLYLLLCLTISIFVLCCI
jgi:hypothetical protein